jgi:hypothetical protein
MSDMDTVPIIVDRSVTKQGPERAGCVLVAGSHGGVFAGFLAAQARLRAVILNDAGVGRDDAGIAGLAFLQGVGMPAATVSCMSARIGDGADMLSRGVISHANERARTLGVVAGQACAQAAALLRHARTDLAAVQPYAESRYALREDPHTSPVWGLDSASLVRPEDFDRILMIGSHGGLLGGDPASALRGAARAAVFNDAGVGIDGAGLTRLPALDARGMPAATVDCWSARIGDARSMWQTGVLSHVNAAARALGAAPGMPAGAFADLVSGAR